MSETQGFSHLHVHSEHSSLDGMGHLRDLCRVAADDGQAALALTDHGTLGGLWRFAKAARAEGLKPIAGVEAYLAIGDRMERNVIELGDTDTESDADAGEGGKKVKRYEHLTLLARNDAGWRNLLRMTNAAEDSYWYHPRIDYDLLREHGEGIIVLTGCLGGPVLGPMAHGDWDTAEANLLRLIECVGRENVYVEVMEHGIPEESAALPLLHKLAKKHDLPLVATNDAHFTHDHDTEAHDAWLAVQTKATVADEHRFRFHGDGYHLRTEAEMRSLRPEKWWRSACDNTVVVADRCSDVIPEPKLRMPHFRVPEGYSSAREYLVSLVRERAEKVYGSPIPEHVRKRLNDEMRIIRKLDVVDYFLIVWDVIEWCRSDRGFPTQQHPGGEPGRKRPILVGPGRGCLHGDSLIWTTAGYRPIRDIQVGDEVRTHTGAVRAVANTFVYDVDETLVTINGYSGGNGVSMTADHKVLIRRAELETDELRLKGGAKWRTEITTPLEWVPASEVREGDLLCIPRPKPTAAAPTRIDVAELIPVPRGRVTFEVTENEIIERVPVNHRFDHSIREVSSASGVSRTAIARILGSILPGEVPIPTHERHATRATRMRDRLLNVLSGHGFSSLAAYRKYLHAHQGETRYPHSAHAVAKEAAVNAATLRKVIDTYPEAGPIRSVYPASRSAVMAREKLVAELQRRGFSSIAEWAHYVETSSVETVRTPRYIQLNNDLMFVLGAVASNGWIRSGGDQRRVGIAERRSGADGRLPLAVARVWGLGMSRTDHKVSDLTQWYICSAAARALIHHLMPGYEFTAQTKRLPDWILDLDDDRKNALLDGLWWGDGSSSEHRSSYSTTSPHLMMQVRDLLWSVGAPAGVQVDERRDERPEFANRSIAWAVRTTPGRTASKVQFGGADESYVYSRVRSVERAARATQVHDLEVPVDHSFMTDSYVVHNSAAGSMTSFLLGIVQVDPLENGLLFERFLEPGRVGMPDIDIDFQKSRREEVLEYLTVRWGTGNVARIGSFSASKSRRALRDAARVLGIPKVGDALSKLVPIGEGGTPYRLTRLEDTGDAAGDRFRAALAASGDDGQAVIELARRFEDTVNGESIHACGTLVADEPLADLVPLRRDRSKATSSGLTTVSQWDGRDIDDFGLLKLDVLGLRNLDIVARAVQYIEDLTGEKVDPDALPHPDTKGDPRVGAAWALLGAGKSEGVFQMDSSGMQQLARDIQPDCLADLSAIVALYRPGPLSANMHTMYARRKSGADRVEYTQFTDDPAEAAAVQAVLGDTYGVMIFQEQLMLLGTAVAGFDAAGRSKLRKAVGKKIKSLMDEVGEAFLAGAEQEVRDEDGALVSPRFKRATAERLWDAMKGAAEYSFNKSHSAAYAQLAYVTAYLKANWPAAYGAALLAETDGNDKRLPAIHSLRAMGVKVKAPDVNLSRMDTAPVDDRTVTIGLGEVKGVGQAANTVVLAREDGGPFTSFHDFVSRVTSPVYGQTISVGAIEALIEAGALDRFGPRMGLMMLARGVKGLGDVDVPGLEWGILERSRRQRARIGVIMGKHPLKQLADQISRSRTDFATDSAGNQLGAQPVPVEQIPSEHGATTVVIGVLSGWSERAYSRGQMANLSIEGVRDTVRGVMWDEKLKALRSSAGAPVVGSVVVLTATVAVNVKDVEDEEGNVIDTVTTRELTVSRVMPVEIDDSVTGSWEAPKVRIPRRWFAGGGAGAQAEAEPVRPALGAVEAEPLPDGVLPVFGRAVSDDGATVIVWPDHAGVAVRSRIIAGQLEPAPVDGQPGLSVALVRGKPNAVVVSVPAGYAYALLRDSVHVDELDGLSWGDLLIPELAEAG